MQSEHEVNVPPAPPVEPAPAADPRDLAVCVRGVEKAFGDQPVVRETSLDVEAGEFVSILGPSGCGKTTLLRMIGGFEHQDAGSIHVRGTCVGGLPPNKRDVNMVFQRYALFPHKTVRQNVSFPLEVQGVPAAERRERVAQAIALVGLEGFEQRDIGKLSGGQAQRVALARALVGRPQVLLLDEPLTALDLKLRKRLQLELRRIQEELRTTFVYVTHDQEEALTMSDRIVVMNDGRIEQIGTPEQIYGQPDSVFVSRFIGEANLLDGTVSEVGPAGARVAVAGAEVLVRGYGIAVAAGDSVVVSLRPERLSIGEDGEDDADNALRGRVERMVFFGASRRYHVALDEGETVTVQTAPATGSEIPDGTVVTVRWSASDAVLLPPR